MSHRKQKPSGYEARFEEYVDRECIADTCNNISLKKGYCNKHYLQIWRHGKLSTSIYEHRKAKTDDKYCYLPIGVNSKDGYTKVDIEFSHLDKYKYRLVSGYAVAFLGKGKSIMLHRLITNVSKEKDVDHRNHDKLDNTLNNLRICSRTENCGNSFKQKNSANKFKGVFEYSCKGKYISKFRHKKLGVFDTAIEAAKVYDKTIINAYGEFALTNKMMGKY